MSGSGEPASINTIIFEAFNRFAADPSRRNAYIQERCACDPELLAQVLEGAAVEEQLRLRKFMEGQACISVDEGIPPGTIVGDFRIEQRIGGGAMGTVYRAQQISVARTVALKFLNTALGAEAAVRFSREGTVLASIKSQRVVQIYLAGFHGDRQYIAMEFVEGTSLHDMLRLHPPGHWRQALTIALSIAEALEEIHTLHIAHRDVKPSNILVTADQSIKLVDFGIAWRQDSTSTLAGQAPGTPAYMPPEQILRQLGGPGTDFAQYKLADIYSFGIVLFEILTGTRPFRGETCDSVEHQIVHSPFPLGALDGIPDLPPAVRELIRLATNKNPAARTRGMSDPVKVLRSLVNTGQPIQISATIDPPRPRRGLPLFVFSGLSAAVLLLAAFQFVVSRNPPVVDAARVAGAIGVAPATSLPSKIMETPQGAPTPGEAAPLNVPPRKAEEPLPQVGQNPAPDATPQPDSSLASRAAQTSPPQPVSGSPSGPAERAPDVPSDTLPVPETRDTRLQDQGTDAKPVDDEPWTRLAAPSRLSAVRASGDIGEATELASSLQAFYRANPASQHLREASEILNAVLHFSAETSMKAVLASYVVAYRSLKPENMRKLVSAEMLSRYAQWCRDVRRVEDISIANLGSFRFEHAGAEGASELPSEPRKAAVTADLYLKEIYKNGERPAPVRIRKTITLVKTNENWVIASLN